MPMALFSGDVRTGKTTALMQYFKSQPFVGGFFSPDVGGIRKFIHAASGEMVDFQHDGSSPDADLQHIGRFSFLTSAFQKAADWVKNDMADRKRLIIIDEWGPLELQKRGFYPLLINEMSALIAAPSVWGLVVVRQSMLQDFERQFERDLPLLVIDAGMLSNFAHRFQY